MDMKPTMVNNRKLPPIAIPVLLDTQNCKELVSMETVNIIPILICVKRSQRSQPGQSQFNAKD